MGFSLLLVIGVMALIGALQWTVISQAGTAAARNEAQMTASCTQSAAKNGTPASACSAGKEHFPGEALLVRVGAMTLVEMVAGLFH